MDQHHPQCDLREPACNRCIDSGNTCEGYARYPVFLVRTQQGPVKRRRLEEVKPPEETSETGDKKLPYQPATRSSKHIAAPALSKYVLQRDLVQGKYFIMNSLSSRVSNANMSEAQLISAFWECYTPSTSMAQAGSPCAWLQQSICVPNPPPALRLSLKALAMTRLGWLRKDEAFVHEGKVIYVNALRELQKALYNQNSMWQDETMAACNVLALYEVSRFPMSLSAVLTRIMQLSESTSASIIGYNSHVVSYLVPLNVPPFISFVGAGDLFHLLGHVF